MVITATPEFQVFYESLGYGVTAIPGEVDVIVPVALLPPYIEGVEVGTGAIIAGVDTGEKIVFHGVRHNVRSTYTHASGPDWDIADYESFQYLVTTKIARVRAPDGSYIFHAWRGSPGTNNLEAAKAQINIMRAEVGLAPVSTTTETTAPAITGEIKVKVNTGPLFPESQGQTVTGILRTDGDTVDFSDGSSYSWRNTIIPGAASGYVTILSSGGLPTTSTAAPSVPTAEGLAPSPGVTPPPPSGIGVIGFVVLAGAGVLLLSLLAGSRRRRRA